MAKLPNEKWVSDITFIETREGFLYLAVILDLFSRAIIGWSMSHKIDERLVQDALNMAVERRDLREGLLLHSDQGSQYKAKGYRQALSDLNIKRISVAKPGESNKYMEDTKYGDLSLDCHRRVKAKFGQHCFGDVYTRMSADKPSSTITTRCSSISNGRFGHYDIGQNRGISIKEASLLQSFPRGYVFYPIDQIAQLGKMIGNAVPPKLASFFASYLISD